MALAWDGITGHADNGPRVCVHFQGGFGGALIEDRLFTFFFCADELWCIKETEIKFRPQCVRQVSQQAEENTVDRSQPDSLLINVVR